MGWNLAYNMLFDVPEIPWAIVPMSLHAFGIALVFPVLTLMILDMYPRQRGSASSLQAFTSLVMNAALAGVVSPWLVRDPLWLAGAAALLLAVGYLFWRREAGRTQMPPAGGSAMAAVPGESV
jgi:DHA1 family bicyclomycin/chloramphenicol resistance-like MFS transporter